MSLTLRAALALSLLASMTTSALAQASSSAADAVSAERPSRGAVGRRTYPVPRDLSVSGSVSDMLRTVPFVDIDADGEVTLRGDPHVVILVDGRSSIELSAGWRALALQRMPAGAIEAIEVITGVSAQFPSHGAGVINIVTRKAGPQD